jgi:hypothetical protein
MCIASERVIVLDVRQDRYFMVPPAHADSIVAWLAQTDRGSPPNDLVHLLRASGVHQHGDPDPHCPAQTMVMVPPTLPEIHPAGVATVRTVAAVSCSVLVTAIALKRRPLDAVLSDSRPSDRLDDRNVEMQRALAQAFEVARRFIPVGRRCLIDSLALMRWLKQHGQRAQLVFGVSGHPFAAHCWVQTDSMLLNDSYERVSRFTPIRVQ